MNTVERLQGYYTFDDAVTTQVATAMESQAGFTSYTNFLTAVGASVSKPFDTEGYSTRQILDIRPEDHDDKKALVVHLPMANPLDANQLYQVGSLAYAMPNTRIIAMGHPSGGEYKDGGLTHKQRRAVANGNFKPVIDPLVAYLDQERIEEVDNVGNSYGTELAASFAANGSHAVGTTVYIEPASVVKRNIASLGKSFKSSEPALAGYVEANDLPSFLEARENDISGGDYIKGLLRPTNIAITRGLARGKFEDHAISALTAQPDMHTSFAWGSESELALDSAMLDITEAYAALTALKKVMLIRLPGQKHALGNDLALSNAVILQSLAR